MTTYDGTLERTPGGGVIRFERHLPYAIDDVWDAVTNPARLAEWWLPFDAVITVDLRPGGEMVFTGAGDEPVRFACEILQVEPPVLLEHTHVEPGSSMRWELEAVDAGTVLRLSHTLVDVDNAVGQCFVVGLHTSLARLEPALAGHPISWDDADFEGSQAEYAALGLAPAAV